MQAVSEAKSGTQATVLRKVTRKRDNRLLEAADSNATASTIIWAFCITAQQQMTLSPRKKRGLFVDEINSFASSAQHQISAQPLLRLEGVKIRDLASRLPGIRAPIQQELSADDLAVSSPTDAELATEPSAPKPPSSPRPLYSPRKSALLKKEDVNAGFDDSASSKLPAWERPEYTRAIKATEAYLQDVCPRCQYPA